jgi:type II secretory pathway pseudopilin PulG
MRALGENRSHCLGRVACPRAIKLYCWASQRSHPVQRRAMTLLEIAVALGLLGMLMSVSVQMLRVMGERQRAAERRGAATQTVQALTEQLSNMPWEHLTAQAADAVEIPAAMSARLPGSRLSVAVIEESEPIVAKRVTVELRWNGPRGQPARPMRLTTWVYPEDES